MPPESFRNVIPKAVTSFCLVNKMAARQLHLLRCNLPENQHRRKRRIYRRQLDPLQTYTDAGALKDAELRSRYRFSRQAIQYIVGPVADDIAPQTNRIDFVGYFLPYSISFLFESVKKNLYLIMLTFSSASTKITAHSAGVKFGFLARFAGEEQCFLPCCFATSTRERTDHATPGL